MINHLHRVHAYILCHIRSQMSRRLRRHRFRGVCAGGVPGVCLAALTLLSLFYIYNNNNNNRWHTGTRFSEKSHVCTGAGVGAGVGVHGRGTL